MACFFKMMVAHLHSWINEKPLWQAQSSSAATTTNLHANNAMQTHDGDLTPYVPMNTLGKSPDVDISKFLERKVKIFEGTWNVSNPFTTNFRPWTLLFRDDRFRDKIHNYALLKGKLMLTFYINGAPQHAGMLLASFSYLGSTNEIVQIGGDRQIVTRSQRPHVYLNASTSKSGCICVPFFFPTPYIPCLESEDPAPRYLGQVFIDSIGSLLQLNGGTDSISITVFAQLVDPVLAAPTPQLWVAESDEYEGNGPVSGPASAVADMAGMLESVPAIAPYAIATRMAASTISYVAKLFGYSRPAVIDPVIRVKNHPVSSLALTDDHDTCQKLTVTSKAELSIDPRLAEMEPDDTLSFKYLTQKESYLGFLTWSPSDTSNDWIGTLQVNPMSERIIGTSPKTIIPTMLSFVSRPMQRWSGTIRVRIQVVATQFHRGRFALIYIPNPWLSLGLEFFNVTFNTIIDLAEGRDFTFDINWQNQAAYLPIDTGRDANGLLPGLHNVDRGSNGVLLFQVVNKLAVPDSVTPVRFLVSISAGDNFELANPTGRGLQVSRFVAQSAPWQAQSSVEITPTDENSPEGTSPFVLTTNVDTDMEQKALNYFGETILSGRQLIKRYNYVRTVLFEGYTPSNTTIFVMPLLPMPPDIGYDPNGPDTDSLNTPYCYGSTTYHGYYRRAFAAWKGALRWKIVPISGIKHMSVSRRVGSAVSNTFRPTITTALTNFDSSSNAAYVGAFGFDGSGAGTAITQNRTMDALEFEVPFTSEYKFSATTSFSATNTTSNLYPGGTPVHLRIVTEPGAPIVAFELYAAAGEDFQVIGCIGAPVSYLYDAPTT